MSSRKVAIVTGASTGIGKSIAVSLGRLGHPVALIARSKSRLEQSREAILGVGGHAEIFPCDLRIPSDIERTARAVEKSLGPAHVIVNCAGVWHNEQDVYAGASLQDTPPEQIQEVLEVGIMAPFLLTRALLPSMIAARSGKILQISGTFESGAAGWLHYYVAKKAIEHFSEGLAQELRPHEIQVNTISPSDTWTESYARFFPDTPRQQCVSPEEIADVALFLLSKQADHITGACVTVRSKECH